MAVARQTQAEPGAGFEYALIGIGGSVIACGFATYLGARLTTLLTGGSINGGLDAWLRATVGLARDRDPQTAWEHANLPASNWLYWTCTAVAYLLVAGAAVGLVRIWRGLNGTAGGGARRKRFGQETEAREATPGDVIPLKVDSIIPPTGRMLLGRMSAHHSQILATEDRNRHPLKGRAARRQGNRGSVALIGPTGSGKTALANVSDRHLERPGRRRVGQARPLRHHRRSPGREGRDRRVRPRRRDRTCRPLAGHRSRRSPPHRGRCAPGGRWPRRSRGRASPTPSTGRNTARSCSARSCASPDSPGLILNPTGSRRGRCRWNSSPHGSRRWPRPPTRRSTT